MREEKGTALLEAALVTPLLALIFCLVIQFGITVEFQLVTTEAARAGAREYAATGSASSARHAAEEMMDQIEGRGKFDADRDIEVDTSSNVEVTVNYGAPVLFPVVVEAFGGEGVIGITGEATFYC